MLPHHDGSPLYVSTQAPGMGDTVSVRLRVPQAWGEVDAVRTRSNPDHEPQFTDAVIVASADGWDWWEAPIHVENPVHGYRFLISRADGRKVWVNATGLHEIETLDSEDFKLVTFPAPPTWVKDSVLYQVFPDRFARSAAADERPVPDWAIPAEWSDPVDLVAPGRSQQFYGGDLDGVREHLDHLERLGVTLIYLTPVFPGRSNHRYDASSFSVVDPLLGGDDALIRLVEAAHERGMRVIGDLTSNHCGDGHEWFRAAYGNPDAPESEFFYWLNDEHTEYVSWLGVPSLPKFNWNSAELRRRFIEGPGSVVGHWLAAPYNFDGWRIDVSNMTGRYREDDLNEEVRRTIRRTMLAVNPDTILLGESTNDASSDFQGDAWHGAMTYTNFTRPIWGWLSEPDSESSYFGLPFGTIPLYDGEQFFAAHRQFTAGFPWRTRLGTMNALDTHDTPRFLTNAKPGTVPVAFGMSVTLPGIPVVFAGDEFGLTGVDGEASRIPLPWAEENGSAADTIALYASLIGLRRAHSALNGGGMRWLHVSPEALVYVREDADESILVVAARETYDLTLPPGLVSSPGEDLAPLVGEGSLHAGGSGIRLTGSGPSFTAWRLPGVVLPAFAV
ncbi:glycoside hydrolase family 13 protein [Diaminobutyricibacter tongyongensis]|uniref:Glycoside hydrolase family 13 protein n=1 Tax=Leifsonia tongyongensis TaxID=1268043 RepID=A0A6L9Y245_9MICO|nr:glycoside hydrolase family 13 protein [Diaminobutyricibacter tongyongensis]NEN07636.1 glycoside hydrolase family 13 protein [Diaminobutyricibacter tongyongensis]